MNDYDVIVLGGGAAGLMCAIAAGRRGRRVVVLESANKIGKKILMSGGGRCNFTNLHCEPSRFISQNPNFCISALSRYTPYDFIALVEQHGIPYHEKTLGQLFCDRSSKDILGMLVTECQTAGVVIHTDCETRAVQHGSDFTLDTSLGAFRAGSLVIATGGLSIPKLGATDFGLRLARQFGLRVHDTRPGLVPFTLTGALLEMSDRLSGLSLPVVARLEAPAIEFPEALLFTHRGLSGPAILQLSSYWQPGQAIHIDLLPGTDAAAMLLEAKAAQPRALLRTVLAERLPKQLVRELQAIGWAAHAETRLGEMPDTVLHDVAALLNDWTLKPAATEGYRTAEVTLGGIDTEELSSRTFEAKRRPGLYCIGEAVDVTGHLGGYNFQWAWASGHAAGEVA